MTLNCSKNNGRTGVLELLNCLPTHTATSHFLLDVETHTGRQNKKVGCCKKKNNARMFSGRGRELLALSRSNNTTKQERCARPVTPPAERNSSPGLPGLQFFPTELGHFSSLAAGQISCLQVGRSCFPCRSHH